MFTLFSLNRVNTKHFAFSEDMKTGVLIGPSLGQRVDGGKFFMGPFREAKAIG